MQPRAIGPDAAAAVVICCRDRAQLLTDALPAVFAVLRPGDEVVVVDSGSRDDSVREVAVAAGARVVRCDRPGLGLARNAGWRSTERPVIVFTDDDCRPHEGWVAAAAAALAVDRVGVVWGRVLADVPATESAGGIELSLLDDRGPAEGSLDADLSSLGHGADMAFRREVLEQLGGFDAALGAGSAYPAGEDKDVFWRAMRAGWRAVFTPAMAVTHVRWRGESEAVKVMYRYGIGAGAVAAKRRRLDGTRGLVGDELMRHGIRPARRALRRGRLTTALGALARAAGVVAGARRAGRAPMTGDLLDPG